MGKRPKQTFLQRRHRWLTNTLKNAQHCSLLDKCKSKPQDITSHWSEWPSSKILQITNAGKDVEKREQRWGECKLVQPLLKTVWRFLRKLKTELPYGPTTPLLGTYIDKTVIQKDIYTPSS